MGISNKFSLIIPIHNRHEYLKRSIQYFSFISEEVIYVDSSTEPYTKSLPNNFSYYHLPGFQFHDKMLFALKKCSSEYVALCADDDFIAHEALYEGQHILRQNKEKISVVGKFYGFHEEFDGKFYHGNKMLPEVCQGSAKERVKKFFSNYHCLLWAMHRKKNLKPAFEIVKKADFKNDNFIELTIAAVSCSKGVIEFIDKPWGFRELSGKVHWGDRHPPLTAIYQSRKIQQDSKKFLSLLDEITFKGCGKLVIQSYLSQYGKNKYIETIKGFIKIILKKKAIQIQHDMNSKKKYKNLRVCTKNDLPSAFQLIHLILQNQEKQNEF